MTFINSLIRDDDDIRYEELPRGSRANINGYSQARNNETKKKRSVHFKDELEEPSRYDNKSRRPNDMEEYAFDDLDDDKHRVSKRNQRNAGKPKRVQFKMDEDVSDDDEEDSKVGRPWNNTSNGGLSGQLSQSYPGPPGHLSQSFPTSLHNNITPDSSPLPPPKPPEPILSPDNLSPPPPLPQSVINASAFPPPSVMERKISQNPGFDQKMPQNVPPRYPAAARGPPPGNAVGNPAVNPSGRKPRPNLTIPTGQSMGMPMVNGIQSPQSPTSPTTSQRSSSLPNQRGMNLRPPGSPTPSQRTQSLHHSANRPRPSSPTSSHSGKPAMPLASGVRGQPTQFQLPPNPNMSHNVYVGQPPSPSPTSSSSSQQTIRNQPNPVNYQKPPSPVTQGPPGPAIAPKPSNPMIRVPLPIANLPNKPSNPAAIRGPAPPPRNGGNIRPPLKPNNPYNNSNNPPAMNGNINNNNNSNNNNGGNFRSIPQPSQPSQPVPPARRSSNNSAQNINSNVPYRTVSTPNVNKLPQQHNHISPGQFNQTRINNVPPTRGVSQQDLSSAGKNLQRGNLGRNTSQDHVLAKRGMQPNNRAQSLMAISTNGPMSNAQKISTTSISEEREPSDMSFAARRAMFSS